MTVLSVSAPQNRTLSPHSAGEGPQVAFVKVTDSHIKLSK